MDNKENKQFYWEVKDFMNQKQAPAPASRPSTPSVVDSVKNILEQNNLYRQSSFNSNINSVSTIRQAISAMESAKRAGTPESPAFAKNVHNNGFQMVKEATAFDVVANNAARLASSAAFGSLGSSSRFLNLAPHMAMAQSSQSSGGGGGGGSSTSGSGIPTPQSHMLPDGTWVDDEGNEVSGSPGSTPPPPTPTPSNQKQPTPTSTQPSPQQQSTQQQSTQQQSPEDRRADIVDQISAAHAMHVPILSTMSNKTEKNNYQEWRAATTARNAAIAAANIAARRERDKMRDDLRTSMDAAKASRTAVGASARDEEGPMPSGQGSPQSVSSDAVQKAQQDAAAVRDKMIKLRRFNDNTGFNRSVEMGDPRFSASAIATRYSQKPGQIKPNSNPSGYRGDPNLTDLSKPLPPEMQAVVDEYTKNPKQNY